MTAREFGAEDLDGDLAVVLEVVGEVDGGHAARAELAFEAVAVGEGGGQAGGRVGAHRPALVRWRSSAIQFTIITSRLFSSTGCSMMNPVPSGVTS